MLWLSPCPCRVTVLPTLLQEQQIPGENIPEQLELQE